MIPKYSHPEMTRVWSDQNKIEKWLAVEIAACEAWAEQGVVPIAALPKIRAARFDLARIAELEEKTQHDVTAFLGSVAESVGEEARYVHLGLTSSDVVDTALALQIQEATAILLHDVDQLTSAIERKALQHKHTVMVGRTHGIHAEPTTFGFKLAGWVAEMRRNRQRVADAGAQLAVGKISGAVGTHATVPPEIEEAACTLLGLQVAAVSTQIIQRDRHAQFIAALAIVAASLEKFATEIRGLQRTELREAEERFGAGQTGSSAMPHKRNPVLTERIAGLARLVRGYAVTALENVALWHERDISHSSAERIIFPDACGVLDYMLRLMTRVVDQLTVYPERMIANLNASFGLVYSQRVLLALIDKGMSREEAYRAVQRNAMRAWDEQLNFMELLEADPQVSARLTGAELANLFDYSHYLRYVDTAFQRLGLGERTG